MEKTISLGSHKTHYWVYGDTKKPLLIMIHGFRGTHHGLLPIAKYLSDFYVVIPDLPGFGASDAMASHTLDSYVEWLHDFCQSISRGKRFSILGHSFGSIIVSHYAAGYPDVADKVVLVNPISTSALGGSKKLATKATVFYYWLGQKLPTKLSQRLLSNSAIVKIMSVAMTQSRDRNMRRFVHDQHKKYFSTFHSATSVLESFRTSTEHTINTDLRQPTLLVVGQKDMIAPLKGQLAANQDIKNSQLITVNDVGHLIHYEKPKQAALAIKDFLLK